MSFSPPVRARPRLAPPSPKLGPLPEWVNRPVPPEFLPGGSRRCCGLDDTPLDRLMREAEASDGAEGDPPPEEP